GLTSLVVLVFGGFVVRFVVLVFPAVGVLDVVDFALHVTEHFFLEGRELPVHGDGGFIGGDEAVELVVLLGELEELPLCQTFRLFYIAKWVAGELELAAGAPLTMFALTALKHRALTIGQQMLVDHLDGGIMRPLHVAAKELSGLLDIFGLALLPALDLLIPVVGVDAVVLDALVLGIADHLAGRKEVVADLARALPFTDGKRLNRDGDGLLASNSSLASDGIGAAGEAYEPDQCADDEEFSQQEGSLPEVIDHCSGLGRNRSRDVRMFRSYNV